MEPPAARKRVFLESHVENSHTATPPPAPLLLLWPFMAEIADGARCSWAQCDIEVSHALAPFMVGLSELDHLPEDASLEMTDALYLALRNCTTVRLGAKHHNKIGESKESHIAYCILRALARRRSHARLGPMPSCTVSDDGQIVWSCAIRAMLKITVAGNDSKIYYSLNLSMPGSPGSGAIIGGISGNNGDELTASDFPGLLRSIGDALSYCSGPNVALEDHPFTKAIRRHYGISY